MKDGLKIERLRKSSCKVMHSDNYMQRLHVVSLFLKRDL
jgi:hypothetical protein